MNCSNRFEGPEADTDTARVLAALAHPTRLRIVRQLACLDASCCKDIVAQLDLAQSTVSQHLKILVDAGLVRYRPAGQSSRYSIQPEAFAQVASLVSDMANLCCPPDTMIGQVAPPQPEIVYKD
ncbi:ArsR/SmtB family transcription factor [Phyllobacterium lublinensis]|uniref:ArsR/SmtB family transcription factor n=1 Tax=Phyllobacterium lublinensis TaxID=2875708 RepID=UPI001CCD8092|nr:metalloregulator ArsR/SmtB family transcription factor [Phyllobacterium sp. 2063]MBZ9655115.1 metalloregulator ArsR/SmtB family transcription factor [Phyllobacterium sp. 2063]